MRMYLRPRLIHLCGLVLVATVTFAQAQASSWVSHGVDDMIEGQQKPGETADALMHKMEFLFESMAGRPGGVLTTAHADLLLRATASLERAGHVSRIFLADEDDDGAVRHDELLRLERYFARVACRGGMSAGWEEVVTRRVGDVMRADLDQNGKLDWSELIVHAGVQERGQVYRDLEAIMRLLLSWDADRDGRTTIDEFRAGVTGRLAEIDTDRDGVLSEAEISAHRRDRARQRLEAAAPLRPRSAICPEPLRDEAVMMGGASSDRGTGPGGTLGAFLVQGHATFTLLDSDGDDVLTTADLDLRRQWDTAGRRAGHVRLALWSDLDGDGVLTREEMALGSSNPNRPDQVAQFDKRMRADTNRDGRIDGAELLADARQHSPRPDRMGAYFLSVVAIDRGETLTREAYLAARERIFTAIDTDGNGTITQGEHYDADMKGLISRK